MIELERHIEILLLSNDCVIVPGLGGFMTNHVDARYDESDSMFLPPLRTLGFNPKLTLNDSLLAQSYIEAYDISYPEAIHRIEDEVDELRQHLENTGSYELNDIGILRLNDDGNFEFEPCEAGILTPSLYALSSFEIIQALPSVQVRTKEKVSVATTSHPAAIALQPTPMDAPIVEPVLQPVLETEANDGNAATDSPSESSEEVVRTVSIRVSLLRNLAAAAIVIVAFLLFPSPLGDNTPNTAAIDSSVLLKVVNGNTQQPSPAIQQPSPAVQQPSPAAQQPSPATQQPSPATQSYYTIVLASHVTKANAASYVEQLRKQGFDAEVFTRTSTKVIFGKFATESEAFNRLRELSDNEPFTEAWVLKIANV